MVDVSQKDDQVRDALAIGKVKMSPTSFSQLSGLISSQKDEHSRDSFLSPKGNVFVTAQLAGIQGAKFTSQLIPLCHPISLSKVEIECKGNDKCNEIIVNGYCKSIGKTGVEMEALTGVSVACLTIYDMCKALKDPELEISNVRLISKTKRSLR